jgi:hypothetical protein
VLVIVNHPDSLQPNRIQSSMLRLPQQSQQYKQVEVHTSDQALIDLVLKSQVQPGPSQLSYPITP